MNMDAISSQLISRSSFDRSPESRSDSAREDKRVHGHHRGHRAHHTQRQDMMERVESNRELDVSRRAHGHRHDEQEDVAGLTYRRSERTSLTLKTQEGDTVRLKIKATEMLAVDAGKTGDDGDGQTISELDVQASSRTRIAVRVNGDLNEQEMAAIQSVIDQAGAMAEEFFSGNTSDAFASASELEIDATQLANVRIRMKTSEQLTYPMAGALQALGTTPQVVADEPVIDEAQDANPASTATSPAVEPDETPATVAGATGDKSGDSVAVAPREAESIDATGAADRDQLMASVLQSIGSFLNNLFTAFSGGADDADNSVMPTDMTLKLQVFRSMLLSVSDMQNAKEDGQATDLAAETIDAINAQQTPLDAVA
ncbi:MAG: hypothetical protein KJO10_05585 [Gammaproteobacteria bacterium]|nr:hypothetical protein [Gammaproteobacteria bacterium]